MFGHIAQGQAREFNFKFDVACAVVAVDHRGARSHADLGHLGQHHRAALAGHTQAPQGVQVLAGTVLQFDHDGDLALVQVEFRQTRVVVAGCGHAQGLANRRAGHAQVGGGGKVGHHHHLGAHQAGAGSHIAQTGDQSQLALNGLGRAEQGFAVFASQHQDVFFARTTQADFAAHAGQGGQGLANLLFNDLFSRPLPALAHQQGEGGFARFARTRGVKRVGTRRTATDGGVNAFDVRHLVQQLPGGFGAGLGLGQLGARGQLQIHLGLAVVVGRNEARGQQRHQGQRTDEKRQRAQHRPPAVLQTPLGQAQIAAHPGGAGFRMHDGAQQVSGHHGGEGARHDQRGKHRQRCSPAKLLEKLARYTGHEGGRQKHRDQGEGGGNHRQANFIGGLHGGLVRRLAHAQMAHDVLHLDDGVVDQDAHHQRQGQQGHHIDRKAQGMHADEGGNHRQGQSHGGDEGGTPVAQKQPDHDHRQDGAFIQQVQGALVLFCNR